ncbi:MAG TPA: hypothetical protein ENI61_00885 [Ignavibacteria bacterium]|nr:hypothetical protein [Ignavibacteria bacterium]
MKQKIQLITSGISLVDKAWGGFYRGGTYILLGPRKSGRTLISLQYSMESARQKEVCLYFTNMRPKDLMIHAASIDFDLQYYMNQNLVIVVRVASPTDIPEVGDPDEFLIEYLNDIVTVVEQYQPSKIVFDELTPFIGFNDVNLLEKVFAQTVETIEESGITSLFLLGEPVTRAANDIAEALITHSTGVIYLNKESTEENTIESGMMTITPNIGHTEGKFKARYYIEPYKGITVDFQPKDSSKKYITIPENTSSKYKSLADIVIPKENYSPSNFYSLEDFKLILNNQIALFKSTGQTFTLVSVKLDKLAEEQGLLTFSQLRNAVRLSTDRKDKLCTIENKIIVLLTKEEQNNITSLISKIRNNLPDNNPTRLRKILNFISIYALKVHEDINKAEDIINELLSDEHESKNQLGFH